MITRSNSAVSLEIPKTRDTILATLAVRPVSMHRINKRLVGKIRMDCETHESTVAEFVDFEFEIIARSVASVWNPQDSATPFRDEGDAIWKKPQ